MSKINFLLTAYQCNDVLAETLAPFLHYRFYHPESKISIIHSVFKENHELGMPVFSTDGTCHALEAYHVNHNVDYLHIAPNPLTEAEARNSALKPLLENGCDFVFIADLGDEFMFY